MIILVMLLMVRVALTDLNYALQFLLRLKQSLAIFLKHLTWGLHHMVCIFLNLPLLFFEILQNLRMSPYVF